MPTIPFRVSTFHAWPTDGTGLYDGATYVNGVITVTSLPPLANLYVRSQYRITGAQIGITTATATTAGAPIFAVRNLHLIGGAHGDGNYWSIPDPGDPTMLIRGANGFLTATANVYMNNVIYGLSSTSPSTVYAISAPGGTPNTTTLNTALLDAAYGTTAMLGTSDTGDLYIIAPTTGGVTDVKMWKFGPTLNLLHFWNVADTIATRLRASGNFFVFQNMVCCKQRVGAIGGQTFVVLVKINGDLTLSDFSTPLLDEETNQNFTVQLSSCLGMTEFGVFSLCANQPMIWTSP